jgi:hypothetical protein
MEAKDINVLIGCEESQAVCIAFRERGFNAFSCDIIDCSGGHPEWHIKGDILTYLNDDWDMMIGHPPCTRLTNSVIWYIKKNNLQHEVEDAAIFFNQLLQAGINHIAIENPIQHNITRQFIRKQDQVIQPYNFNEDASKATCLWLKNLPRLKNTGYFNPRIIDGKKRWSNQTDSGQCRLSPSKDRAKLRSKTFPGIANAMAQQWGDYLLKTLNQNL